MRDFVYRHWVRIIFAFVFLATLGILNKQGILHRFLHDRYKDYDGETSARIISVEPLRRISEGRFGTRIQIIKYKVQYSYVVDNRKYDQVDSISNVTDNIDFLGELLDDPQKNEFVVKFKHADPQVSTLAYW